jgi:thioredoxin-related protein
MTTNNIKMLIDLVEHCPYCKQHADILFLKKLLDEVEKQPFTAVQIAVIKSPKMFNEN